MKEMSPPPQKKVHFVSLGCPKNLVDTEIMLGSLMRDGYKVVEDAGDAGVEQPAGADPLGGLDPGEHRDAVRLGGDLLVQQFALGAAAVFQVDQ